MQYAGVPVAMEFMGTDWRMLQEKVEDFRLIAYVYSEITDFLKYCRNSLVRLVVRDNCIMFALVLVYARVDIPTKWNLVGKNIAKNGQVFIGLDLLLSQRTI